MRIDRPSSWLCAMAIITSAGCAASPPSEPEWEQSCGGVPEPEPETPEVADVASCELEAPRAPQPLETRDEAGLERAKQHVRAAQAFVADPDGPRHSEALVELQQAYQLTASPKALLLYARAATAVERNGEALDALQRLLSDETLSEELRTEGEKRHAELERRTAWVELRGDFNGWSVRDRRLPTKGQVVLNEYRAGGCGLRLGLEPGDHTLTFSGPNGRSVKWTVQLAQAGRAQYESHFAYP